MILAHQGGWDELLLVLVPIAVIVSLLWLAERRASRNHPEEGPETGSGSD